MNVENVFKDFWKVYEALIVSGSLIYAKNIEKILSVYDNEDDTIDSGKKMFLKRRRKNYWKCRNLLQVKNKIETKHETSSQYLWLWRW